MRFNTKNKIIAAGHRGDPAHAADTTESAFYEAVEYGCSMFTENDPETVMKWRDLL